jgi:hypothetical protein
VGEFYGVIFVLNFILFIPVIFLRERSSSDDHLRSFTEHSKDLWDTLKNLTTLYLIIFVTGTGQSGSFLLLKAIMFMLFYIHELYKHEQGVYSDYLFSLDCFFSYCFSVVGIFSSMTNIASVYLQYYVIGLTNFQSGIGKALPP